MNEIEKRSMRRWLVGAVAGLYRIRNGNSWYDEQWAKGYFSGKEITLSQVAVRLFGSEEAIEIFNEAEKEAAY